MLKLAIVETDGPQIKMQAPQPLRRSKRLRRRPLRYAEVGTLTYPNENLFTIGRTIQDAREMMLLAKSRSPHLLYYCAAAMQIILEKPAATAHCPVWRTEVTRFIYKHERTIYSVPCEAQRLFRAYWAQYPALFHHPLWRDGEE
jgi:hypothetical protein